MQANKIEQVNVTDFKTVAGLITSLSPALCKLTFDLLTLKMVSESRVTWPTSVPIIVFLDLSVLDLGPMYATDRQTSDAHNRLMPPTLGRGHNKQTLGITHHPMRNIAVPPLTVTVSCNPNPALTLTLTLRDPDYQQTLTISSTAHVPPFHRILRKSAE